MTTLAMVVALTALTLSVWASVWGRRRWIEVGWVRGRVALISSMVEAQRRGMSVQEWLIAEAERDGWTITLHPEPPET